MNDAERYDVLIVGAGPAGMTLANLLGQQGLHTLVIDKERGILMNPRAIALDNEALRVLQMAGLAEDAFEKLAIPAVRMRSPWLGEFAQANTAGCLDGHPKLVTFYQPELEQALARALQRHASVRQEREVTLLGFRQQPGQVEVDIQRADGSIRQVQCRYLVGADGANSLVRRQLGIEMVGSSYVEDWLIIDAQNVPQPIEHVEFLCDPKRPVPHMVAPGGRERWEFMLHPGETREAMLAPETIRRLLSPWVSPEQVRIERTAVYRFQARVAERFQEGRVFLVGDAAHLTPPFVGQGLVAGLRDAGNLAWKLGWVLQQGASERILASYDQERRPHAAAMIRLAVLMGKLIMPTSAVQALLVHGLVRLLRCIPPLRALFDEMKIKPQNRFRDGLFASGKSPAGLQRGSHFRQGLLYRADAGHRLSDDVLQRGLTLIGFGVDPQTLLDEQDLARWQAAGGRLLQICHPGQRLRRGNGAHVWEDSSGSFFPDVAPFGWLAVVRPDNVLITDGPAAQCQQLVRDTLALLH